MGNFPNKAEDFKDIEHRTVGTILDSWVTGYHYEGKGGQVMHGPYRKNFKLAKIYADGGRMYGYEKDGSKIWLSNEQGTPYPDSFERAKKVKGYGTGPMLLVSGTIDEPKYYVKTASELSPDWSWAQINSMNDLEKSMSLNKGIGRIKRLSKQTYDQSHLGTASRNVFLGVKPGDINSWAHDFNKTMDEFGSKLIIGAAEAVADEFTAGAFSTIFQLSGGEAMAQEALDKMIAKKYSATSSSIFEQMRDKKLNRNFMDQIHDERINERFKQLKPFAAKYKVDMSNFNKFDQKTQRGLLRGYTKYVTKRHVNEQMQELQKQVASAQGVLGTKDFDFTQFRQGWKEAKESERLGLLNHYKGIFKGKVLPRLEANLIGFHPKFDASLEPSHKGPKGSEKQHESILEQKKYIVGDIIKQQKTAQRGTKTVNG